MRIRSYVTEVLVGICFVVMQAGICFADARAIEEGSWFPEPRLLPDRYYNMSLRSGKVSVSTDQGVFVMDRHSDRRFYLPWAEETRGLELMPGGEFWSVLRNLRTPAGRGAIRCYDGIESRDFDESCGLPGIGGMWSYLNPMFARDAAGDVWAAYPGVIWRFDGKRYESYQVSDFLAGTGVRSLTIDSSDVKWFGLDGGYVASFDGTRWALHGLQEAVGTASAIQMAALPQGGIWAVWGQWFPGGISLTRLTGLLEGSVELFPIEPPIQVWGSMMWVSMVADQSGRLWMTYRDGAYCLDQGELRHYTTADGLASDYIVDIDADEQDGAVGFLCSLEEEEYEYAVSVLSEGAWLTYHAEADLPWEETDILKIDDEGSIWLGGGEAYSSASRTDFLWRIGRGGRCDSLPPPAESALHRGPARVGDSFFFSRRGSAGSGLAILEGDVWQTRAEWDGIPLDNIKQIEADAFGRLWVRRDLGPYHPTALVCIWPEANWAAEYRPRGYPFDISCMAPDRVDDCIWLSFHGREECYGYGRYGGFQKLSATGIERVLENAPRFYVGVDARNMKWVADGEDDSESSFQLFDGQNWDDIPTLPWPNLRTLWHCGQVVEHTGDFVVLLYDHEKWAALDDPSPGKTCSTIGVYNGKEWRGFACPELLKPECPPRGTYCSIPITGVDWLGNYWLGLGVLVPPENFILAPKAIITDRGTDESLQLSMSIEYRAHPHKADLYVGIQAPSGQVFYIAGQEAAPPFPIFYAAFDASTEFLQPGPNYTGPGSIPNTPAMKDLAAPPLSLPDPYDGEGPTGLALFAYPVPYYANVPLPAYGAIDDLVLLNTTLPEEAPAGAYTFHVGLTGPFSIKNVYRSASCTFEVRDD